MCLNKCNAYCLTEYRKSLQICNYVIAVVWLEERDIFSDMHVIAGFAAMVANFSKLCVVFFCVDVLSLALLTTTLAAALSFESYFKKFCCSMVEARTFICVQFFSGFHSKSILGYK